MENQLSNSEEKKLSLLTETIGFIVETAKWTKFLSIIGFVFVGFMIFISIVMMVFLPSLNEELQGLSGVDNTMASMGPILGILYILIAGIYLVPVIYLYKFSEKTLAAVKNNDENILSLAFKNLKSHFKFMGIFTIVFLSLYVLIIIGAFIGGILGTFM
ncbi:MAG: hypothetical protein GQ527_10515 [Bacteroidales bacterium]|nr:hypothetical protein [Bacteroidales bacterium]